MRFVARLMRCAMGASGTAYAASISALVRPPTARSVSASRDGADWMLDVRAPHDEVGIAIGATLLERSETVVASTCLTSR
jgi:hypothetical protein